MGGREGAGWIDPTRKALVNAAKNQGAASTALQTIA